ncbi:hypothetical protein EOL99_04140 [Candidatus Falkowbacteria bacterium]|nr:hypothetical protein [Candidatus Falkowbacteria bacterium]
MKFQDPPVYRASYEMSIAVLRFARDLPEKYQSTLGLILETKTIEMQDVIYRINESEDKAKIIYEALGKAYFIRMALRLFLDLGVMKVETNVLLNMKIEEVLKQLSGWRKALI